MPNWKKVVVSGSDALLNSVTASFTGSLTGALIGTASWAQSASQALTASRAISSSYALSASFATTATEAFIAATASYIATVRNTNNAVFYPTFVDTNNSVRTPEDLFTSNLIVFNPGTSTFGAFNISGSSIFAINGFTGSLQGTASWAVSASQALTASRATSASYALSASYAPASSTFPYAGAAVITGSLIVSGSNGGINTINSVLTDSITNRVEWANGLLNASTGLSIDWENRILYEPGGGLEALNYSNSASVSSQLYYNNVISNVTQRELANNPSYAGQVIQASVDAAVALYNLVYLDTDGVWYPLKNLPTVSTKMLGICVDTGGYVLIEGDIGASDDNTRGAYVIGANYGLPIYIGGTNGVMTTTIPASGVVRVLGHVYHNSSVDANWWTMKFRPSTDWYEI